MSSNLYRDGRSCSDYFQDVKASLTGIQKDNLDSSDIVEMLSEVNEESRSTGGANTIFRTNRREEVSDRYDPPVKDPEEVLLSFRRAKEEIESIDSENTEYRVEIDRNRHGIEISVEAEYRDNPVLYQERHVDSDFHGRFELEFVSDQYIWADIPSSNLL